MTATAISASCTCHANIPGVHSLSCPAHPAHAPAIIADTPTTHLRNALQIIAGIVQDELRLIGYKVDGLSCSAITHEELEGIHNRITSALTQLELLDRERAGILKTFLERV